MTDILSADYTKKIQFLFYIEYKLPNDLEDEKRSDIIVTSHENYYKIKHYSDDNKSEYEIEKIEPEKLSEISDEYFWMTNLYINYNILPPYAIYFEENRQDYHKMHFDIISNDGSKGVIFLKNGMIPITNGDIVDILNDLGNNHSWKDIIDYYQNKHLEKYFKEVSDEYEL